MEDVRCQGDPLHNGTHKLGLQKIPSTKNLKRLTPAELMEVINQRAVLAAGGIKATMDLQWNPSNPDTLGPQKVS